MFSCEKENVIRERSETVVINNSDTLEYSLGFFGDEEGVSIKQQANYYMISRIHRDTNTGEIIYQYRADSTYYGTDYVKLRSARGSDGASDNNDILITKLMLEVKQ